jgi:hypothetical protein
MHTARDPSTSCRAAAADGRSKPLEAIPVLIGGDYPLYLTGLANLVRKHANLDLADVVSSEDIVTTLREVLRLMGEGLSFSRDRQPSLHH